MNIRFQYTALNLLLIALFVTDAKPLIAQEVAALPPQRSTIMQHIIQNRPVLVELLTSAGFVPILSGDDPYTLLAPPEESLKPLKEKSPEELRRILAGHILKGKYAEVDFKDGAKVEVNNGGNVNVCRKQGHTMINGVKISRSTVVRNGVVHDLDAAISL